MTDHPELLHRISARLAGRYSGVFVAAMSEMGLDLTKDHPKPLTDDVVRGLGL